MEKEERKSAVALRYDRDKDRAPKVTAKGAGIIADQIMEIARQRGIPVYRNQGLTNLLMAVDLDREVPPELYKAVAEVLAYVYRIDKQLAERRTSK